MDSKLRFFLQEFHLSEEEQQLVCQLAVEKEYKAHEILFQADRVFDYFLFIEEGMIRSYRMVDGNDFTYSFFIPGEICVDFQSYLQRIQSNHYFETLVPTRIFRFEKDKIEALFNEYPRIERIAREMAEKAYIKAVERLKEFQTESLETRYLRLIENQEELFKAAPLQHIASYLGVKPQSLSRIRAKIVNKFY
ncbi:Cyclic nucleotide-binding domain protein [compost metagenome]